MRRFQVSGDYVFYKTYYVAFECVRMSENTEAGGGVPGAERGGSAARRVRQHVRAQQQQARPQGQEARPHRGEVLQL